MSEHPSPPKKQLPVTLNRKMSTRPSRAAAIESTQRTRAHQETLRAWRKEVAVTEDSATEEDTSDDDEVLVEDIEDDVADFSGTDDEDDEDESPSRKRGRGPTFVASFEPDTKTRAGQAPSDEADKLKAKLTKMLRLALQSHNPAEAQQALRNASVWVKKIQPDVDLLGMTDAERKHFLENELDAHVDEVAGFAKSFITTGKETMRMNRTYLMIFAAVCKLFGDKKVECFSCTAPGKVTVTFMGETKLVNIVGEIGTDCFNYMMARLMDVPQAGGGKSSFATGFARGINDRASGLDVDTGMSAAQRTDLVLYHSRILEAARAKVGKLRKGKKSRTMHSVEYYTRGRKEGDSYVAVKRVDA